MLIYTLYAQHFILEVPASRLTPVRLVGGMVKGHTFPIFLHPSLTGKYLLFRKDFDTGTYHRFASGTELER